jgi:zinc protease
VLDLAADILENRLVEQIRITEGATYSPQCSSSMSEAFKGFGYVWSKVETPPEKIASFYANVAKITADMRTNGITGDELVRAKTPVIESIKKRRLSNDYWLVRLERAQTNPRLFDEARNRLSEYEKVTAEDIKRVMAQYFTDERAWKMIIRPSPVNTTAKIGDTVK